METQTLSPPPKPPKNGGVCRDCDDPNNGRRSPGWAIVLKLLVVFALAATAGYVAGHFFQVW
jgi:hypothetical protein